MSKIKNGGLDQYGAEPFEQQQFAVAGVEWVIMEHKVQKCLMPLQIVYNCSVQDGVYFGSFGSDGLLSDEH